MDVHAGLDAPADVAAVFRLVDDLAAYRRWVDLVHAAAPEEGDDEGRPAWTVELRARVGPLARSKRLRMVRTRHEPDAGLVVFERRELDGRRHAPWVLTAKVIPGDDATEPSSRLEMHLHYGGALWTGGVLERVLADQISRGRERLVAQLSES